MCSRRARREAARLIARLGESIEPDESLDPKLCHGCARAVHDEIERLTAEIDRLRAVLAGRPAPGTVYPVCEKCSKPPRRRPVRVQRGPSPRIECADDFDITRAQITTIERKALAKWSAERRKRVLKWCAERRKKAK